MPGTLFDDAPNAPRFRCDPCGFSAGVVVNGRDDELGLGERTSLSLVACPRCGRRNGGNVAWFFVLTLVGVAGLGVAAGVLVQEERTLERGLALLAVAVAAVVSVIAARRFLGARRAVRFLPY
jgi:hypothetical protein